MAQTLNLNPVVKGNTKSYSVTLYTDATKASVVPISAYSFFFTVKEALTDTDANAKIIKEPTDFTITDDVASFSISSTDTDLTVGNYYYDIKYIDGSGNINTFVKGILPIANAVGTREAAL